MLRSLPQRLLLQPYFLFFFLCCTSIPLPGPGAGEVPDAATSSREKVSQARELLRGSGSGRQQARQAAVLLEKSQPSSFPTSEYPLLLAEAWYRSVDPESEIEQTFPVFEKVEKYAEQALKLDPEQLAARYWLGLARLRKAQKVGGFRAVFIVRGAIRELEKVQKKLPQHDQGGAARALGRLYQEAPAWTPFGDLDKAVQYGREAVRLAPDFVLNRLYLARAYLKAEQPAAAAEQFRKIMNLPPNRSTGEARRQLQMLGSTSGSATAE